MQEPQDGQNVESAVAQSDALSREPNGTARTLPPLRIRVAVEFAKPAEVAPVAEVSAKTEPAATLPVAAMPQDFGLPTSETLDDEAFASLQPPMYSETTLSQLDGVDEHMNAQSVLDRAKVTPAASSIEEPRPQAEFSAPEEPLSLFREPVVLDEAQVPPSASATATPDALQNVTMPFFPEPSQMETASWDGASSEAVLEPIHPAFRAIGDTEPEDAPMFSAAAPQVDDVAKVVTNNVITPEMTTTNTPENEVITNNVVVELTPTNAIAEAPPMTTTADVLSTSAVAEVSPTSAITEVMPTNAIAEVSAASVTAQVMPPNVPAEATPTNSIAQEIAPNTSDEEITTDTIAQEIIDEDDDYVFDAESEIEVDAAYAPSALKLIQHAIAESAAGDNFVEHDSGFEVKPSPTDAKNEMPLMVEPPPMVVEPPMVEEAAVPLTEPKAPSIPASMFAAPPMVEETAMVEEAAVPFTEPKAPSIPASMFAAPPMVEEPVMVAEAAAPVAEPKAPSIPASMFAAPPMVEEPPMAAANIEMPPSAETPQKPNVPSIPASMFEAPPMAEERALPAAKFEAQPVSSAKYDAQEIAAVPGAVIEKPVLYQAPVIDDARPVDSIAAKIQEVPPMVEPAHVDNFYVEEPTDVESERAKIAQPEIASSTDELDFAELDSISAPTAAETMHESIAEIPVDPEADLARHAAYMEFAPPEMKAAMAEAGVVAPTHEEPQADVPAAETVVPELAAKAEPQHKHHDALSFLPPFEAVLGMRRKESHDAPEGDFEAPVHKLEVLRAAIMKRFMPASTPAQSAPTMETPHVETPSMLASIINKIPEKLRLVVAGVVAILIAAILFVVFHALHHSAPATAASTVTTLGTTKTVAGKDAATTPGAATKTSTAVQTSPPIAPTTPTQPKHHLDAASTGEAVIGEPQTKNLTKQEFAKLKETVPQTCSVHGEKVMKWNFSDGYLLCVVHIKSGIGTYVLERDGEGFTYLGGLTEAPSPDGIAELGVPTATSNTLVGHYNQI